MIGNVWDYNKKFIIGNAFRYDKKSIIGNSIFFPAADRLPLFWDYHNEDQTLQGADLLTSYVGPVPDGLGGLTDVPFTPDGLFTGPAYTNLFTTSPNAPEAVVLTVQDYTLVCIGGSVSSSYGVATEATPLTFTAAAGSTTFTPTDVDGWLLVANLYVLPVVPPGTSVPSSAATSGGNGASFLMDDSVLDVLRGAPDGVELAAFTSTSDPRILLTGDEVHFSSTPTDKFANSPAILVSTDRLHITFEVYDYVSGAVRFLIYASSNEVIIGGTFTGNGVYNVGEALFPVNTGSASDVVRLQAVTGETTLKVRNISVQKLNPAVGTVTALVKTGVGSDELPVDSYNTLSSRDSVTDILYNSDTIINKSSDLTTIVDAPGNTWDRNEIQIKLVQFTGIQFRVGSFRYGVDSSIQWSSLVPFDGSFNPLDYLRLAYNGTVPVYFQQLQVWSEGDVAEAEILKLAGRYI